MEPAQGGNEANCPFSMRTIWRGVSTYVYVNNHYAGFAPATVEQFEKLWSAATGAR
jgi:uncharacterized protein YecE (DUF72 family)